MYLVTLIVGVALLATAAVLLAAVLGIAGRAMFLATALILAAAMVVGESILLSLPRLLTSAALLSAQALWLAGALAIWWRRGRPRPPAYRPPAPAALARAARARPLPALLGLAVALALATQAVVAVAVAPNESDSIAYHLPRAAFWVQYHSALQYHAGAVDDPEQVHPPNAELLVAWTMALSHSDRFAQLVQWLALVGAIAVIFAGARLVGLSRSRAGIAAGLFALMPEPLIQSATTQNDLVLTFLLISALLFGVRGIRGRERGPLVVAALAAGLAFGTKLDIALMVPAGLLVIGATVYHERPPRSLLVLGASLTIAALLALGSFVYVQNEIGTHRFTGFTGTPSGDFIKTNPARDAIRVGWNMLDAPNLTPPDWLRDAAESAARHLFAGIHGSYFGRPDPAIRDYASADESAYGLVGLLLLLPLLGAAILRRRAPPWQRLLALGAVSYYAAYVVTLGYNPEAGRYLMPAVALAAPLLGQLAGRRGWAALAVALALASAWGPLLHETYKPLLSTQDNPSVLSLDRIGQQTFDDESLAPALRRLSRVVGSHDALGYLEQDNLSEYYLFGEPLQHRLVGFEASQVTARAIRANRLRGVFIGFADQPPCVGRHCIPHTGGLRFVPLGANAYLATPITPARARQMRRRGCVSIT